MKKKYLIIFIIAIIAILATCIIIKNNKNNSENNKSESNNKRYSEIKENVKIAIEKRIKAQYPSCPISNEWKDEYKSRSGQFFQASGLINNGYIKKSELLDVDNKSYCDVYVIIKPYYEDPKDQQHNCHINYNFYLKCNDYEDEGYIDWGQNGNEYR